jgi:hypothetical protein
MNVVQTVSNHKLMKVTANTRSRGTGVSVVVVTRRERVSDSDPISTPTMSSLHSCHWGGCPFTTSLHDDFVRHVISTHVDEAKPVKRMDIGLIRHAEQAASSHSGELNSGGSSDF